MRSAFGAVPFAFHPAMWSDPLGLPASAGAGQVPQIQAMTAGAITAHAVLVSGRWPGVPRPGQPIPAALGSAAASLLHLSAGDLLLLHLAGKPVQIRLTGVFRPRDPSSAYWRLDLVGLNGFTVSGRITTYGPLIVSRAAFGGALAARSASWVAEPETPDITDGDLGPLAAQVTREEQLVLDSATLGGLQVTTGLPALLSGLASNLVVAHSQLLIGGLELLLLGLTALVLAVRLLAAERQAESALVSARGGARWQLAQLNAGEAMLLAVIAVGGGMAAGGWLAGLLARAGSLRAATLQTSPVAAGAWWAATATSVACGAVMLGFAPRQVPPGAVRARRGRQAATSGMAEAGIDLALVLVAAVAVWELRRYSAVIPSASGTLGVDPVLAVAPVLALAGGTAAVVRVLPTVARTCDRLAGRGRRLAIALACWQVGRQPLRQAGAPLLVVLAVATAMLALSQHQSWLRSAHDQAAFLAGAQVRVDTPLPVSPTQAGAIAAAPQVRDAMPVAQLGYGNTGEAVALDATRAAHVVLLRPDLSPLPAATLFKMITPATASPGVVIPGRPARVQITASLGPATLGLAPAAVTLSVQDADGDVYALAAGSLRTDGRTHGLTAGLTPTRTAVYPLRLLAVTLDYGLPRAPAAGAAMLTVRAVAASAAVSGPFGAPFAAGTALAGWTAAASSPGLAGLQQSPGSTVGRSRLPRALSWRAAALSFDPGYGQARVPNGPPGVIPGQLTLIADMSQSAAIPGIATRAYLSAAGVTVGSIVPVTAAGVSVAVRIVAAVTAFPTVSAPGGGVIVDLAALQDVLASRSLGPVPVSEWWLATASGQRPPGLPAGATVTVPGQIAASLTGDPLSAAPQQALLAIAAAAAVLGATGFCVSVAASVRERRPQSTLLSALGVSPAAQARHLCLEQLMLSVPSAVAGLAFGAVLAWLVVPAVTLTTAAVPPVPPALTELAWSQAVPLATLVVAVPVLAAAVLVRRPDPAARLRITEAA
ncbi:MAG: FtsX-like permease family protein, partial [Streptosporangiaceae bacterium]